MALQSHEATHTAGVPFWANHQDIESEIGALSSRHGISLDAARAIINKCGKDRQCIDEHARKWKLQQ